MTSKTIGIIIAHMASSRLPGKALRIINSRPLLSYVLERLQAVDGIDEIWLATTQHTSDEQLLLWGIQQDLHVIGYPGEIEDIVGRISATLQKAKADRFIVVQDDTPFIDSRILERFLKALDDHPEWEAVAVDESEKQSAHVGIGCYRTSGWQKIDAASTEPKEREIPGSILKTRPDVVQVGYIQDEPLYYENPYRLIVETQADLNIVEGILKALHPLNQTITLESVLHYLKEHPELIESSDRERALNACDQTYKVLMAVQAGGNFGISHLARCKTLTKTLKEHFSAEVTFWLDSPDLKLQRDLLEDGYNVIEGNWSLPEAILQGDFNRLVIDFQISLRPSLVQRIRITDPDLPIIAIDNDGLGCDDVDTIIFPNIHALPNPEWRLDNKMFYSGSQYVIIGHHFFEQQPDWPEEVPMDRPVILVTMGGTDPDFVSEKVLSALKELKDCHIDMIIPPDYAKPEGIEKIATQLPSTITLHWKIPNIRPLMKRATLAVAAFGMTAYELAYMGVPTILLGHYKAQEEEVERFTQWGSIINIGYSEDANFEGLLPIVQELLQTPNRRQIMSERGGTIVDPQGPVRVAEAIVATVREPLSLVE